MIAAILLILNLAQLWHDTNSHAATMHGVRAFAKKQYAAAAAAFAKAEAIKPSPQRAFNLGTAQIAAGDREQGSSTLQSAMSDAHLRAGALFNRGNSALASKAYDSAIRDYSDALRLQPNDGAAKRNLEIALIQKVAAQQGGSGLQPPQQNGSSQPNRSQGQRRPVPNGQRQNQQSADDALLRSVQQQEQEELQRMHRGKEERAHVGW